jgi:hypothetical protein
MKLFKKLKLVFTYGDELEALLESQRLENIRAERDARRDHLFLCLKHQQESQRSHYAEHNCDYCKAVARNLKLVESIL